MGRSSGGTFATTDTSKIPLSTVTTADDLIAASGNAAVTRVAVAASRLIGKKASGTVGALTAAEAQAILVPTPAAITQTYATADATLAAQTAGATVTTAASLTAYGYTQAQADAIVTNLNALRADHLDLAQAVNSVIDALQAANILS